MVLNCDCYHNNKYYCDAIAGCTMPSSIPSTSTGSGRKTKSFCNFSGLLTPQMTQMARYGIIFNIIFVFVQHALVKKMITINFASITPRDHSANVMYMYNVSITCLACPHLLLVYRRYQYGQCSVCTVSFPVSLTDPGPWDWIRIRIYLLLHH